MVTRTVRLLILTAIFACTGVFGGFAAAYAQEPANTPPVFQQFALEAPSQNVAIDGSNRVWYTLPSVDKLAMVTPEGVVTHYPVDGDATPNNSQPYDLAVQGNNVWFTMLAANQIGVLDMTNGAVQRYTIPTSDSQPTGISLGSGFVWFVERAGDKLGRFDPATQTFTEYYNWTPDARNPVDMRDADLEDVAWSGDGVWITGPKCKNSGALYRVNENRFIPSAAGVGAAPMQVVVDSEGSAWVTFSGLGKIGQSAINTLGVWNFKTLPAGQGGPVGLFVRNHEGRRELWYTRPGDNRFGYVLVGFSGAQLGAWETSTPAGGSAPWGIAVDSASRAWFSSSAGANVVVWNSPFFTNFIYMPSVRR